MMFPWDAVAGGHIYISLIDKPISLIKADTSNAAQDEWAAPSRGSARSRSPGRRYLNGLTSRFARPAKAKPLFGRGRQGKRRAWVAGGTMQYLLILLVVI